MAEFDNETDQEEKTEEATSKRREEFREAGQIPKTRELTHLLMVCGLIYFVATRFNIFEDQLRTLFSQIYSFTAREDLDKENMLFLITLCVKVFFGIVSPFLIAIIIVLIAANLAQSGFILTTKTLEPSFNRINPAAGLARLFNKQALFELLKSFLKMFFILVVTFYILKKRIFGFFFENNFELSETLMLLKDAVLAFIGSYFGLMAVFSIVDYLVQRNRIENMMKMTKQEVKTENKEREGDPQIKAKIRTLQRLAAQRRLNKEIQKADVIITNPTHFAVAIKYDPKRMVAPRVIAKGADFMAQRIKQMAKRHGVPVVENKALARFLYKNVKVGQSIPKDLYQAMAEVLIYVYRLKQNSNILREITRDLE